MKNSRGIWFVRAGMALLVACMLAWLGLTGLDIDRMVRVAPKQGVSPEHIPLRIGLREIWLDDIEDSRTPLGAAQGAQAELSEGGWAKMFQKIAASYPGERIYVFDVNWDGVPEMLSASAQADGKMLLTQYRAGKSGASVAGKALMQAGTAYSCIALYRNGTKGAYAWLGRVDGLSARNQTVRQAIDQIAIQNGTLKVTRMFEERASGEKSVYFYKGKKASQKSYKKQYDKFFKTYRDQGVDAPAGTSESVMDVLSAYAALEIEPIHATGLKLNKSRLTMAYGATYELRATVTPAYATEKTVMWTSDRPDLVEVDQDGALRVVGYEGRATITAKTASGVTKTCAITVKRPAAKSVAVTGETTITMHEPVAWTATVSPEAAAQTVSWSSSNKRIALVDQDGLVTPVAPGEARITAKTKNGKKSTVTVRVVAPIVEAADAESVTRRAVLLSAGKGTVKNGGVSYNENGVFASDTDKMHAALRQSAFGGAGIHVTSFKSAFDSGAEALSGIVAALKDADDNDVSYVYIMCHGAKPSNGRYYIRIGNGSSGGMVTSAQLRTALDRVRGTIVLMMSSCYSGDVVGKSAASEDAAAEFVDAFLSGGPTAKSGEFAGDDKYYVLCGSSKSQVGFYNYIPTTNDGCSFLCNAVNYALGIDNPYSGVANGIWQADQNRDDEITMAELYASVSERVRRLCVVSGINDYSRVQVWPENSDFVVFAK